MFVRNMDHERDKVPYVFMIIKHQISRSSKLEPIKANEKKATKGQWNSKEN